MTVDPRISGRITALTFQGRRLLSGPERHADNWGATYWTSPQSDWGWPPLLGVDGEPYRIEPSASGIHLVGPSVSLGARRFRIEKKFDRAMVPGAMVPDAIDATYVIRNEGEGTFSMASWEISRVEAGGLTFFPSGAASLTPIPPHAELVCEEVHETTFYDHSTFEIGACRKLHADGKGGYLAHLSGDLLMLKVFEDSLPEEQAPGEGECEIFANEDGKYVEVEVQGPYRSIGSGQASSFSLRTAVLLLPPSLTHKDRAGLRAFADEWVARLSPPAQEGEDG